MKRKTLYIICAIAVLGFALSLLFIPKIFWSLYGAEVDDHGIWIGRYLTAVMFGNFYLFWRMKDFERGAIGAKYFSQAQTVEWGLVGLYIAIFTLNGGYTAFAWGTVALSFALAILCALDGFKE